MQKNDKNCKKVTKNAILFGITIAFWFGEEKKI